MAGQRPFPRWTVAVMLLAWAMILGGLALASPVVALVGLFANLFVVMYLKIRSPAWLSQSARG